MTPTPEAFKGLTLLSSICDEYLGMTYAVARRKHALGTLSIKAFRLSGTRRGPLFVHNDDLEAYVRKRHARAPSKSQPENDHAQSQAAVAAA